MAADRLSEAYGSRPHCSEGGRRKATVMRGDQLPARLFGKRSDITHVAAACPKPYPGSMTIQTDRGVPSAPIYARTLTSAESIPFSSDSGGNGHTFDIDLQTQPVSVFDFRTEHGCRDPLAGLHANEAMARSDEEIAAVKRINSMHTTEPTGAQLFRIVRRATTAPLCSSGSAA